MLLILPPSETKRDGGREGSRLELAGLVFPELLPARRAAVAAVKAACRTIAGATAALGLGPTQRAEIDRNRALSTSPVMPALERYTGVLFDGLDPTALAEPARRFAADHVLIHSALFGLISANDPIPVYRLSHDSRLPGVSLRSLWREPVRAALAGQPGLVLDLRSEAYAALGPAGPTSTYLRVVSDDGRGRRVALSHFNKKAKGEFTRSLLEAGIDHPSADDLLAWAAGAGWRLEQGATGELDLVV